MQRLSLAILAVSLLNTQFSLAEERYFEGNNGVTYREQKWIERRPVTDTRWEESARTVYREQYVTQMRDAYRTVVSPVTEYQMEPRWHNWWNPFGRPYVAYHMLPRTRWETRYERYQSPVTYREVVPETRTVMTPRRTTRFVEKEVTEMVAVRPRFEPGQLARAPVASSRVATRPSSPAVGGIQQLDRAPHLR